VANISGKSGTCTVAASPVKIADWEWNEETDLPDATDSGTAASKKAHVIGRSSAQFTLRGFVDTAAPQPTTLASGTAISTINLTLDGTVKYVVASATVKSMRVGVKIGTGETVDWEATCVVNGTWTALA